MSGTRLSRIAIVGFRSIKNLTLESTGRFNLLVGGNNSGKTSILEAISLGCRPLDSFQWIKVARGRDVSSTKAPIIESLKWLFPKDFDNESTEIKLKLDGEIHVRSITASLQAIYALPTSSDDDLYEIEDEPAWTAERGVIVTVKVGAARDNYQHNIFEHFDELEPLERFTERFRVIEGREVMQPAGRKHHHLLTPVKTIFPHTHRIDKLFLSPIFEEAMLHEPLKKQVLELLQKFDPKIRDIKLVPKLRTTAVYLEHDTVGSAPLQTFGDGLRKILQIAVILPSCQNGVLLLDEIETSIHSSHLESFFDWLFSSCAQLNIQVFATTHSLEAVDSALSVQKTNAELVTYKLHGPSENHLTTRFGKDSLYQARVEFGLEIR